MVSTLVNVVNIQSVHTCVRISENLFVAEVINLLFACPLHFFMCIFMYFNSCHGSFFVGSSTFKANFLSFFPLQVYSIVQVVGVILCLNAAAKISHRAQGVGSIASRWHALATCTSGEASQMRNSTSMSCLEAANRSNSFYMNFSESDLESVDFVTEPTNTQLASYMSSYHNRQALGM